MKMDFCMMFCRNNNYCLKCKDGKTVTQYYYPQLYTGTELNDYSPPPSRTDHSRTEETTIFNVGSTMSSLSNGRAVTTQRVPNVQTSSPGSTNSESSNCDIFFDTERGILNFSTLQPIATQSTDPPKYADIYRE